MKLLPKLIPKSNTHRQADDYHVQLRREAKMGGELFGPIAPGHRREFFCLDVHTWVWHEEWIDTSGHQHVMTTRYDIRPHGILKSQGNQSYQLVTGQELRNFYRAARMYRDRINTELVGLQQLV